MKKELLRRINNPAARKRLRKLLNNGFSLNEEHIEELVSGELRSSYIQVFPTVNEKKILNNINIDIKNSENLFLLVEGNPGLHWKATELVKVITEKSDAKIVWNFHPSDQTDRILKIITLSY